MDVLTLSICLSAAILSVPLLLSRCCPQMMSDTLFFVPTLDPVAHGYTLLKSLLVLSSWVFAYIALQRLPLSVVSPMQATRPMWTLLGALILFDERLNGWQWTGVALALGTIFLFSLRGTRQIKKGNSWDYIFLSLAILLGACAGLYDKYLMRRYDHNAVQVYYTLYQALMMIVVWCISHRKKFQLPAGDFFSIRNITPILLISVFLVISDNVYMLALRDPDSLIAVVSTVRRGGAVIGFAYGLLFLKEQDPLPKLLCMAGILAGLLCLAFGTL